MHPPSLLTVLPTGRDTQLVGLVVIPQATGCSKSLGLYSAGPPPAPPRPATPAAMVPYSPQSLSKSHLLLSSVLFLRTSGHISLQWPVLPGGLWDLTDDNLSPLHLPPQWVSAASEAPEALTWRRWPQV